MIADKKQYQAVLFDLDGVLVDMREAHFEALNLALSAFGTKIKEDEHHSTFNGLPSRRKLNILAKEGRIPVEKIEPINEMKQRFTRQIVPSICILDREKQETLQTLKTTGMKLGCCSNSTLDMVHLMLESAGLSTYFDVIIGNDSVSKPKPDPEMYTLAMDTLGVLPQQTLIVEDSYYGIAAGKASGAKVIEVQGTADVHMGLFSEIL